MVQSKGSRGLRLAGPTAAPLSFPASHIFTNCDFFPAEFSLVATVKLRRVRQKVNGAEAGLVRVSPVRSGFSCSFFLCFQTNEYIFSLVHEGSDSLLLALRISENRLHLLTTSSAVGGRSRMSFKEVGLDDNRWHTVVLAVTGPYATLTVDCGLALEL